MEEFDRAMRQLLQRSGLPVWREGCVPDGAAWPYVTWQAKLGAEADGRVTVWCREEDDRLPSLLDSLSELLPERGVLLLMDGAAAVLWPESRAEIAKKSGVKGGRVALKVLYREVRS